MKKLSFYDVSTKTKFNSSNYEKKSKKSNGRTLYYAVAVSPSGNNSSRILSKADFDSK